MADLSIFKAKPKNIVKWINEKEKPLQPTAAGFWLRKLNINIDQEHWKIPKTATKEVRLRELQWKIMHNIYATNIMLHKMKVKEDNKCSLCRNQIDYIEHFFYECPPVLDFWKKLTGYIHGETLIRFKLGIKEILFGLKYSENPTHDKKTIDKVNNLILIGKMCISKYKKAEMNTPIYIIFEQEVSMRNKCNKSK